MYCAYIGLWLSTDPLGIHPGRSGYVYSSNAPTSLTDATGLRPCNQCKPPVNSPVDLRDTFSATLGPRDASNDIYPRVGSTFFLNWSLRRDIAAGVTPFKNGATCPCCCKKVGVIQIVRQKATGFPASMWNQPNWKLDQALPYPHGSNITGDPCAGEGVSTNDAPNYAKYLEPIWFKQEFESCVVCLEGRERGPYGRVIYGCLQWHHELQLGPSVVTPSGRFTQYTYDNVTIGRQERWKVLSRTIISGTGAQSMNAQWQSEVRNAPGLPATFAMRAILAAYD